MNEQPTAGVPGDAAIVSSPSDVGGKSDHAEALRGLRNLKVLLGTDAPEVRGWAPAVRQAAQKSINTAIRALSTGVLGTVKENNRG